MFSKTVTTPPDPKDRSGAPQEEAATYSSDALFRGQKEIRIDHQGFAYRLRITRSGGLILNK